MCPSTHIYWITFTDNHANPFNFVLILNSQNKILWQIKSFSPSPHSFFSFNKWGNWSSELLNLFLKITCLLNNSKDLNIVSFITWGLRYYFSILSSLFASLTLGLPCKLFCLKNVSVYMHCVSNKRI